MELSGQGIDEAAAKSLWQQFLEVLIKKGMIREGVLLDEEELYCDCVPSNLENRFFRYRVNSVEESRKNNFNLTYLE